MVPELARNFVTADKWKIYEEGCDLIERKFDVLKLINLIPEPEVEVKRDVEVTNVE